MYNIGSFVFIHFLFTGQRRTQQRGKCQYLNMPICCKTACLLCCSKDFIDPENKGLFFSSQQSKLINNLCPKYKRVGGLFSIFGTPFSRILTQIEQTIHNMNSQCLKDSSIVNHLTPITTFNSCLFCKENKNELQIKKNIFYIKLNILFPHPSWFSSKSHSL